MNGVDSSLSYQQDSEQCRCCCDELLKESETIQITKDIQSSFFNIFQAELKWSPNISQFICVACNRDLKYCSDFKTRIQTKQFNFSSSYLPDIKLANLNIFPERSDPLNAFVVVKVENTERELNLKDSDDDDFTSIDALENFNLTIEETKDETSTKQKDIHDDDLAECPQCLEYFPSEIITKHIHSHNSIKPTKRYYCDKCDYDAAKSSRLTKHCEKMHRTIAPKTERRKLIKDKRKQCPTCGLFIKNLSEHQKLTHCQEKRFFCDSCNYSCYFKTKITRHMQRHVPKYLRPQFPCEVEGCSFAATRKDAVKSHFESCHQDREKSFVCIECGKGFFNKNNLNIHMRSVHLKIKNHLCPVCGKGFFNQKDMDVHVFRMHGNRKKEIGCEICGSFFICPIDLKRHQKKHEEPQFACDFPGCDRKFLTNSQMKLHFRTRHENVKDHVCSLCNSKFSQLNNLKRHLDSVHRSLRINCLVAGCSYTVARKDKYKNHLNSQHKYLDEKTRENILKNVKFE